MRIFSSGLIGLAIVGALAPQAAAQQPPPNGQAVERPGVSPAEVQRMFDAYALIQAQEQLKLSDEQYTTFLVRYKNLQDVRRRAQQERNRILQDLRRLANENGDENQLKDRMKALQELDARTRTDVDKAVEGVDSALDARQQARFRLFEEQMERRKLELLLRARQATRQQKKSQ